MIKTVIIDDEKDARILLRRMLETHFSEVEILAEADDVDTGVEVIQAHQPELVFLDIQMRAGTGFDLLRKLKQRAFEVVFITAYNTYAMQAFQFAAFSYLLKPIKQTDLEHVLDRYRQQQPHPLAEDRLQVLWQHYQVEGSQQLVLPNSDGFRVVELSEILYLEADRNYTRFYLADQSKELISRTLKSYEALLHKFSFYRIHQSYLINLSHVRRFLKTDGGMVQMPNGATLPVSRQRKQGFLRKFL